MHAAACLPAASRMPPILSSQQTTSLNEKKILKSISPTELKSLRKLQVATPVQMWLCSNSNALQQQSPKLQRVRLALGRLLLYWVVHPQMESKPAWEQSARSVVPSEQGAVECSKNIFA